MAKFTVNADECLGCGACASNCPAGLYELKDDKAVFKADQADDCVDCDACMSNCPANAIAKL